MTFYRTQWRHLRYRSYAERKRAHTLNTVHQQRIMAGLQNKRVSRRSTSPMAVAIAITFYMTRYSHLLYRCCEVFYQQLRNESTMTTNILRPLMATLKDSGAAFADHVAAPNGKYNYSTSKCSIVTGNCYSKLRLSFITFGTWLDDRIGLLWWESHLRELYSISWNKSMDADHQWGNTVMCSYDGIRRRFIGIQRRWLFSCSRDSHDPLNYRRMDRLGTLRRLAPSICISRARWFNRCVVSLHGNGQYLVVRQSQFGVTSMWFAYRVNSEIHSEAVIERVWRCTWRPRSIELRDALGGRDGATLEMHLEAVNERVWRCTCEGHHRVNLEMHSEAVIERVWRCTSRLWSSEIGGVLGGGRSGDVDGRRNDSTSPNDPGRGVGLGPVQSNKRVGPDRTTDWQSWTGRAWSGPVQGSYFWSIQASYIIPKIVPSFSDFTWFRHQSMEVNRRPQLKIEVAEQKLMYEPGGCESIRRLPVYWRPHSRPSTNNWQLASGKWQVASGK